jgi:ADP-ribosyl-[dinitrogen reductase] hydrolase
MIDNTSLLEGLLAQGKIRLCDGHLLHKTPAPLPPDFDFSKVEGMLLGVAIGDSLGATSEGQSPMERRKNYGEIRNYVPGDRSNYKSVGVPTDDTQLTFWTLKQLVYNAGLIPDNLAKRFCKHRITGIGSTVGSFLSNYKDRHKPWYSAGLDSLGNGALMRISPIVVPYLREPHRSMYADAALDAMITHNSFTNIASCVAFINILWSLLSMKSPPEPSWWVDTYCSVAKDLEGDTQYIPPASRYINYKCPLWQFTHEVVTDALRRNITILRACDEWGSGANLFETVPTVLYILAKYAQNAEEAIIRAVNDTRDNDSIAAIVGAAVGALHGLDGIPNRWIKGLTGRTRSNDDGEVFKLILMAKRKFWSQ